MKRRGFSHADRVKGGKARAAMKRGIHGRFASLLHGDPGRKHGGQTIHVTQAELHRTRAERGLSRSPSSAVTLRFGSSKKAYPPSFKVVKTSGPPKRPKTKVYNPKYRGTIGGF